MGQHFGEIAFLAGRRRTATILTKNYSTIGELKQSDFQDLCRVNPDLRQRLRNTFHLYQDLYKVWQKGQFENVIYFQNLSFEALEDLHYSVVIKDYAKG